MGLGRYIQDNLLAWDEALNVAFGGQLGETMSEHAASAERDGRRWGCVMCWLLGLVVKNHCAKALANAVGRGEQIVVDAQAPAQSHDRPQ